MIYMPCSNMIMRCGGTGFGANFQFVWSNPGEVFWTQLWLKMKKKLNGLKSII